MSKNFKVPCIQRNIVFFGETGTGKSSAINLILGTNTLTVSNDAQPCTQANAYYEVVLHGIKYNLWDTRGLGEGKGIFRAFFKFGRKELEKFLKERHQKHEIDLLVFCVRGSRATKASEKYYRTFCATTRRLAAPVAIMVTQLEKHETDMEEWWINNSSRFNDLKMEFDDHVCITTLPEHPRSAESKQSLINLITRNRHWETKETGSYFGSRVQKPTPSLQSHKRSAWSLFRAMYKDDEDDEDFDFCSRNPSAASSIVSSYHTPAESPRESVLPSPVVGPPTPHSTTASERPRIKTDPDFLGGSRSPSEKASSVGSPVPSMFYPGPGSQSSFTSRSEENQDCLNELPREFPTDCIKRRKNYPTQRGAFGDVWECDLISGKSSRMVAVKAVKIDTNPHGDLASHKKKLHREWRVWWRLQHKNVVPLLGVVSGFGPLPSMVSPWLCNGPLSRFLELYQLEMSQKTRLLGDVATGLCYLHSRDVIHGDLHSDNILIDEHGTACLTDFGLSFINEFVGTPYLKSSICGGVQFADPALVQRVNNSQDVIYPTKPCDVYSFGGVMLHVMSGKKPYNGSSQLNIFMTVLKGERPQMPTPSHDTAIIPPWYRSKIRMCWDEEESRRPLAEDLVKMFGP